MFIVCICQLSPQYDVKTQRSYVKKLIAQPPHPPITRHQSFDFKPQKRTIAAIVGVLFPVFS